MQQAELERTRLTAPFAGVVAEVSGELNEYVTPSPPGIPTPPAVDLIDDSCFYISAPIDEVDAAKVRLGLDARVTLDAFGEQAFAGTVRRIAPYVLDQEKQARTVEVEVVIAELPADSPLLAGYSADVEIVVDRHDDALHLPTAAIRPGEPASVLLLEPASHGTAGLLVEREIETGLANWERTEVLSGLAEGDQVVLSLDRDGVEAGALAVADEDRSAVIELAGVERTFQVGDERVHALRGVDLNLADGDYAAVMGPSGSGKSTLLNILGLLDRPDAGRYRLDGVETTDLPEERRARLRRERIGFVFQAFHLIPRLTAFENVELPLVLAGVAPRVRRARVAGVLDAVGLTPRAGHRPDQLSGGQRQRVAIARATVMEPGLILADEPTGNLDRASGEDVIMILEGLNQKGLTLVVVTHDPALGERAHRRIRMDDGAVLPEQP